MPVFFIKYEDLLSDTEVKKTSLEQLFKFLLCVEALDETTAQSLINNLVGEA